jgi:TM2 domain-containing membrane protein YozV
LNGSCLYCGHWNSPGANYCARCGRALDFEEGLFGMRSVGLAYGLWALWLVGLSGIHRFYTGRYITGIIWFLTWGLFGIGQLVDLLLIPGMVESKNRRLALEYSYQRA